MSVFGLGLIPFFTSIYAVIAVLTVLAVGNSIGNTVSLSLISQKAPREEMGTTLGVNQSLSSLARFFGLVFRENSYQHFGYTSPFISGGIFMAITAVYTFFVLRKHD